MTSAVIKQDVSKNDSLAKGAVTFSFNNVSSPKIFTTSFLVGSRYYSGSSISVPAIVCYEKYAYILSKIISFQLPLTAMVMSMPSDSSCRELKQDMIRFNIIVLTYLLA